MSELSDKLIMKVGDSIEHEIGKQLWMELNDRVDLELVIMKVKESMSIRVFNMIQSQLSYNHCSHYTFKTNPNTEKVFKLS